MSLFRCSKRQTQLFIWITSPVDQNLPRLNIRASLKINRDGRHKRSTAMKRLYIISLHGINTDFSITSDCSPVQEHISEFCLILQLPFPNIYVSSSSHNCTWSICCDELFILKQTDIWNSTKFWSKLYFLWTRIFWLKLKM